MIQTGNVAVSTTILRALGATSWTLASTRTRPSRAMIVANMSTTLKLYVKLIEKDADLASTVSSTKFDYVLEPLQTLTIGCDDRIDLALIRDTVSTDKATVTEVF